MGVQRLDPPSGGGCERDTNDSGGTKLHRRLALPEATTLVIGGIVGASVFLVPGAVADVTGHPLLALMTWVIAGLLSACAALSFAELGSAIPRTGGTYVHLQRAYRSELIAFLFGWMMLFGYASAAVAVVAIMASGYFAGVISFLGLGTMNEIGVAAALIVGITFLNVMGVRQSGRAQVVLTAIKVTLIAVLIVIPWVAPSTSPPGTLLMEFPPYGPLGIAAAVAEGLILCLFAYSGAHFVTQVAGEVASPERNISRAIIIGFTTVMGLYLLLNITYIAQLPFETLRSSTAVASELIQRSVGSSGDLLVCACIVLSAVAVLNAQLMSYPRIVFALADDGLLPKAVAHVHPRTHAPWVAVLAVGCMALVYVFSGGYQDILSAVAFVTHLFITLAVAGVVVLRVREPELWRPYKVRPYPAAPLLFVLVSIAYLVLVAATNTQQTLIGVGVVATGLPVYYWRRTTRSLVGGPTRSRGRTAGVDLLRPAEDGKR